MEDNVMKAYINSNTAELRDWLKSIDLLPIDYPECDRYNGLIAPYYIRKGMSHEDNEVVIFYRDGGVYDTGNKQRNCRYELAFYEYENRILAVGVEASSAYDQRKLLWED